MSCCIAWSQAARLEDANVAQTARYDALQIELGQFAVGVIP
jgi:hypothetical protein